TALDTLQQHTQDPIPSIKSKRQTPIKGSVDQIKRVDELIEKCLAKNPDDRYQSMNDLKADIDAIKRGVKQTLTINVAKEQPTKPGKGKALPVVVALSAGLLIAGGATWFLMHSKASVDRGGETEKLETTTGDKDAGDRDAKAKGDSWLNRFVHGQEQIDQGH